MTSYLASLAYLRGALLCNQMGVTVGTAQLPSYAEVKRRWRACLDDCQQASRSLKAVINSLVGSISAPENLVERCVAFLQDTFSAPVETYSVREEKVRFLLPRELRA